MTATLPLVSVVIGARLEETDPARCLAALAEQVGDDIEVILVHDGGAAQVAAPVWVRTLRRPGALVPELWADGLATARGEVVALTAGTLEPAGDWVERARHFARSTGGPAAVGGAFALAAGAGPVGRGVLYCRYSRFLAPLRPGPAVEVPGDNALYRTAVLRAYEPVWRDGFWEPFVHARMVADGHTLGVDGDLLVRQGAGLSLAGFLRQRFRHGRVHGRRRSAGRSPRRVRLAALGAPLVPVVMTGRALRSAWAHPEHRAAALRSTPLLLLFYGAWAAGELRGRLDAARGVT